MPKDKYGREPGHKMYGKTPQNAPKKKKKSLLERAGKVRRPGKSKGMSLIGGFPGK